jgi:hypothetical protein
MYPLIQGKVREQKLLYGYVESGIRRYGVFKELNFKSGDATHAL